MWLTSFSYRLGVLGNLTSQELREAGYPGNNSLRDQKCAIQWIKSHMSSFGGDAENITVSGESAGSGQFLYHVLLRKGQQLTYCKLPFSVTFMAEKPSLSALYP